MRVVVDGRRSGTGRAAAIGLALGLLGCQGGGRGIAGPSQRPPAIPEDPEIACAAGPSVAVAPLRRITNSQYANAIRDTFVGFDVGDPAAGLVPESGLGGFRSNASIPVSDGEFRGYADEAAAVATVVRANVGGLTGCAMPVTDEQACVRSFVDRFVTRAYRRPVQPGEVERLLGLFTAVRAEEPFAGAVSAIVEAVLQSPHFLYRIELHEGAPGDVVLLDGYQIAARLAFFLWDTVPDETLLAAAASGELETADAINSHARRMLASPQGQRAIESFHLQWLDVDDVASIEKDPTVYPGFTPELAALMREETSRYAYDVVQNGDGSFDTLLTGGFSYLKGELYAFYGLPPREGDWQRVRMDPLARPGLLTHASFLANHAHTNQTSPVHRGKLIREAFFCETLPAPPPDVDDTAPDPDPDLTTRERFAAHSEVESCASCHQRMDPIGLTLEAYDGIGQHRSMEAGRPVDTSGMLLGTDVEGALTGARDLSERIASSVDARQCLVRNWYRFALDRMETSEDDCSLSSAYGAFEASELNVRELIFAIARSDAFRMAQVPETAE